MRALIRYLGISSCASSVCGGRAADLVWQDGADTRRVAHAIHGQGVKTHEMLTNAARLQVTDARALQVAAFFFLAAA